MKRYDKYLDFFINKQHCAGIIPVKNYGIAPPTPDVLLPLDRNFVMIEKSIIELSVLGVDSIWIVCPEEYILAIRNVVGENVVDSESFFQLPNKGYHQQGWWQAKRRMKVIPIYFLPIHPSDRGLRTTNRDFLIWHITYGIYQINKITRKISEWAVPSSYQISFPHGIYPTIHLSKDREKYRKIRHRVHLSARKEEEDDRAPLYYSFKSGENHITNGNMLGVTFDNQVYEILRSYVLKLGTVENTELRQRMAAGIFSRQRTTVERLADRNRPGFSYQQDDYRRIVQYLKQFDAALANKPDTYSRQEIQLGEVFSFIKEDFFAISSSILEFPYYHELTDWNSYASYLGWREEHRVENKNFEFFDIKPRFMKYFKLGRLGFDGIAVDPNTIEVNEFFKGSTF